MSRVKVKLNPSGVAQVERKVLRELNAVVAEVAATHAGRPVDVVEQELVSRMKLKGSTVRPGGMRRIAEKIAAESPSE